jgi:hypothetical protein
LECEPFFQRDQPLLVIVRRIHARGPWTPRRPAG